MKEIKQQVIQEVEHVAAGGVEFSRKNFTMSCPGDGKWFHKGNAIPGIDGFEFENPYDDTTKGLYHCEYTDEVKVKYYFYVQGRGE